MFPTPPIGSPAAFVRATARGLERPWHGHCPTTGGDSPYIGERHCPIVPHTMIHA